MDPGPGAGGELVGPDHPHVVREAHAVAIRRDQRQPVTGRRTHAQGHLGRVAEPAVGDQLVEQRVRDRAAVEGDDRVARRAAQSGAPVGDREPERGAESPRIERGALTHDRTVPSPEPAERVGHQCDLGGDLGRGWEGGQIASATAVRDVGAHRRDPIGRRFDHAHDRALLGAVTGRQGHRDQLAGEGALDEHDPAVVATGQGAPAGDQALGPHDRGVLTPAGGRSPTQGTAVALRRVNASRCTRRGRRWRGRRG